MIPHADPTPNEPFDALLRQKLAAPLTGAPDAARWHRLQRVLPPRAQGVPYGGWALGGLAAGLAGLLFWLGQLSGRVERLTAENRALRASHPAPATRPTAAPRPDTVYLVKRTIVEHRYLSRAVAAPVTSGLSLCAGTLPAGSSSAAPPPAPTNTLAELTAAPSAPPAADTAAPPKLAPPLAAARTPATSDSAQRQRQPFRLAGLRPRLGLESGVASHAVWSVGPAAEVFFNDDFSFATGVQITRQQARNHLKLGSFNSATGKNFEELYRAYLPERYDQIDEIRIQTAAVSVPLHLRYYAPLRGRWSWQFSVGTVLDASVYQTVQFESTYAGREQLNTMEVSARNTVFHNLLLSTGVQYQHRRLAAQLTPFLLYDFRGTDYAASGGKVGLKGSVWLNLYP